MTAPEQVKFGPVWQHYASVERRFWITFVAGAFSLGILYLLVGDDETAWIAALGLSVIFVGIIPFWQTHREKLVCPYCGGPFFNPNSFRIHQPAECFSCDAPLPSIWRRGPA